jgi:CDP-diacylglycerol--serine O-phosphatidyltransferase
MRKIYIVPNFVTTANMFCGFFSVVKAIEGDFVQSAWLIMAAAIFDMLDGRVARLAKATSQFGVEYDSLSDLLSFGMAPAILLYLWALAPFGRLGWLAAFLFLACGALRLARFNVTSHALPKGFFQGLPIPMAAGMVATFVIFHHETNWPDEIFGERSREVVSLALTFGMASLMVSTIRFPSFKELNWRSRTTFGYLMIGVLAMILIAVRPEVTLFLILSGYVGISLGWNVYRWVRGPSSAERMKAARAAAQLEHSGHGHGD